MVSVVSIPDHGAQLVDKQGRATTGLQLYFDAITFFINADLSSTDLSEANLTNVNFSGTDLRDVKNLTIEQLSVVKTLYEAKNLNEALRKKIKQKYSSLLDNPDK